MNADLVTENEDEYQNELKKIFIRASSIASIVNNSSTPNPTATITMLNNDKHIVKGTAYNVLDSIEWRISANPENPNPLCGFDSI